MKVILTTVFLALMLSPPASSAPSSPMSKDAKTDFTKPFIYDGLKQQAPPNAAPAPYTELRAGAGAKDLTADKSSPRGSAQPQP